MVPIPQRADSCFKPTLEFAFLLSISLPNLPLCCARISQILRVPEYFSCKMVDSSKNVNGRFPVEQDIRVIFVLGGPGSGKGTQCTKIVEQFGFTHLSVGDLLRDEIKSGSDNGTMIKNMIKEGEVVPPEVAIKLLLKAMSESRNNKFLIDGFPRDEENRAAFERITKIVPEFVLFFDCPEEELKQRLLSRNQGRDDDNIETIEKRFRVFNESSLPVIKYYNAKSKVQKVNAAKPIEEVFEDVKAIFMQYNTVTNCSGNQNGRRLTGHEHVTSCTKQLLRSTRRMLTYIFSKVFLWKRACIY